MTVMPADYRSSLPQTATLSTFSDGSDRWPEDSSCWRCMVPMGLGGVDGRQKVLGREGAARTYHGRSSRVTRPAPRSHVSRWDDEGGGGPMPGLMRRHHGGRHPWGHATHRRRARAAARLSHRIGPRFVPSQLMHGTSFVPSQIMHGTSFVPSQKNTCPLPI